MTNSRRSELRVYPDQHSLFLSAAQKIATTMRELARDKGSATLVLTGGITPKPVYELLAEPPLRESVPWQKLHFFWGDERCVDPQSADSNFRLAWTTLLSRLPVESRNVHRIAGEIGDAEQAARLYEAEIRAVFPGTDLPSFDLVLLGMGADGHTASLFPRARWDEDRLVVSVYAPSLQAYRISMTPKLLNAAREVLFMITGAAKAGALKTVMDAPRTDLPAARVRPASGNIQWLVDREAAALLEIRGNTA